MPVLLNVWLRFILTIYLSILKSINLKNFETFGKFDSCLVIHVWFTIAATVQKKKKLSYYRW